MQRLQAGESEAVRSAHRCPRIDHRRRALMTTDRNAETDIGLRDAGVLPDDDTTNVPVVTFRSEVGPPSVDVIMERC